MSNKRTYFDIYNDTKQNIQSNTPITNFTKSGVANNLMNVTAVEIEKAYDELDIISKSLDLSNASGSQLENLAGLIGASRSSSLLASDLTKTNFFFYVNKQLNLSMLELINKLYTTSNALSILISMQKKGYITFVDETSYQISSFKIPAGTIITNTDGSIKYKTIEDAVFTNSEQEVYVPVSALVSGKFSNVDSNVLTKHSLNQEQLLQELGRYIKCSNRFPITNGRNSMNDDELRYSLSLRTMSYGSNEVAVRDAALSVPGVRNILFERGKYGNGTYGILVEGVSPLVSSSLLSIVKNKLLGISGGESIFVEAPSYSGVELNFDLIIDIEANINTVRENVRNQIITYINNIPINGTIVWNSLTGIIMGNKEVKDFIVNYYKLGEYDAVNKVNKNNIVLRTVNQTANVKEKFYTDAGLITCCVKQS